MVQTVQKTVKVPQSQSIDKVDRYVPVVAQRQIPVVTDGSDRDSKVTVPIDKVINFPVEIVLQTTHGALPTKWRPQPQRRHVAMCRNLWRVHRPNTLKSIVNVPVVSQRQALTIQTETVEVPQNQFLHRVVDVPVVTQQIHDLVPHVTTEEVARQMQQVDVPVFPCSSWTELSRCFLRCPR